ncbi:MAG: putative lipopolysaccharide heptosyltransferase III [Thermodesulfovibrionales bacterium]|nr:putative lipopolysaccharide heptosyltransferase III [Thermodesulfovibrionales bacterium]
MKRNRNFNGIKKILVIKLRHIGDVLLTVPVFRALRETFPHAHISALANLETEEVLTGNSLIDEILPFDRNIKKLSHMKYYLKEIDFLMQIKKKGFDMTVDLTGGDRAAMISFVSGARYKLGWESKKGFIGKGHLYTHLYKPNGNRHMVLQNLDVVRHFGINTEDLSVDFQIPEDDKALIKKILNEKNVKEDAPIVHVHPTSRWLFKCWEDEYMAEVMNWLLEQRVNIIVTSSPDERELDKAKGILSLVLSGLTTHDSQFIDLCGKTTIKQLAAISDVSDLFFGVDSAPMHIAAAVGTPVIALFGPSGAFNWGPWDNESSKFKNPYIQRNGIQTFGMHTVIQRDWECIPCGKDGCDGSKISKCLDDIKPGEIINILREKLKK